MADVHSILEALELARVAAVEAKAALADGKIDFKDLPALAHLWTPARTALVDAKNIAGEFADMDSAELQTVVNKAMQVVDAVLALVGAA